jgi:hypothetical protein
VASSKGHATRYFIQQQSFQPEPLNTKAGKCNQTLRAVPRAPTEPRPRIGLWGWGDERGAELLSDSDLLSGSELLIGSEQDGSSQCSDRQATCKTECYGPVQKLWLGCCLPVAQPFLGCCLAAASMWLAVAWLWLHCRCLLNWYSLVEHMFSLSSSATHMHKQHIMSRSSSSPFHVCVRWRVERSATALGQLLDSEN